MIAVQPRRAYALSGDAACADLLRRAGGGVVVRASVRDLGSAWGWSHQTVSAFLNSLAAARLVELRRGAGRRASVVVLASDFLTKLSVFGQNRPLFYTGWHQPSDIHRFAGGRLCIHINRFRSQDERRRWRKSVPAGAENVEILVDSNGFGEVTNHGCHRTPDEEFAEQGCRIVRWFRPGSALVSKDYMCESPALRRTGLSVRHHQALTISHYIHLRELMKGSGVYLMPVLQGATPDDYARHVEDYGSLLEAGAWVGVGSVCKLNGKPEQVVERVMAVHQARPDLRLHGFGQKVTAAAHPVLARLWYSMDSLASSFAARFEDGDANDPAIAFAYTAAVEASIASGLADEPALNGSLFDLSTREPAAPRALGVSHSRGGATPSTQGTK